MNKLSPVTILVVAAYLDLSTYTVAVALRGDRLVPADTQARVKAEAQRVARKLGSTTPVYLTCRSPRKFTGYDAQVRAHQVEQAN
jgi:hypothetical protein